VTGELIALVTGRSISIRGIWSPILVAGRSAPFILRELRSIWTVRTRLQWHQLAIKGAELFVLPFSRSGSAQLFPSTISSSVVLLRPACTAVDNTIQQTAGGDVSVNRSHDRIIVRAACNGSDLAQSELA